MDRVKFSRQKRFDNIVLVFIDFVSVIVGVVLDQLGQVGFEPVVGVKRESDRTHGFNVLIDEILRCLHGQLRRHPLAAVLV